MTDYEDDPASWFYNYKPRLDFPARADSLWGGFGEYAKEAEDYLTSDAPSLRYMTCPSCHSRELYYMKNTRGTKACRNCGWRS